MINLHVDYSIRFGSRKPALTLIADVFNLFNNRDPALVRCRQSFVAPVEPVTATDDAGLFRPPASPAEPVRRAGWSGNV